MAHLISDLLANSCLAAGLAVLIFLVQQTGSLRNRPHLCHALWLLVLVKLVTPPLFAVPVSFGLVHSEQLRNVPLVDPALATVNAASESLDRTQSGGGFQMTLAARTAAVMLTPQTAVAISLVGSLALLFRSLSRVRVIGRLVRHVEAAPLWLKERVTSASRQLRLRQAPAAQVVHATLSPFLWGAWRGPRIVMPNALISTLQPESVELIVKHELAHYARCDHWTNSFATTLVILFWWNPITWWARRELRIQQELCCDRMVLAENYSQRVRYAETLLAAIDFVAASDATCPAPATTFGGCSALKKRVDMIVSRPVLPIESNWACVILCSLMVLPIGLAHAEDEEAEDWSAIRRDFVDFVKELSVEIDELRNDGDDAWAKHAIDRRAQINGILPMLDETLKLEQQLDAAEARQDDDRAAQIEAKLEVLADNFWRAEHLGELEGQLAELKLVRQELRDNGQDKERLRVEALVVGQEELLKLRRALHKLLDAKDRSSEDERRIDELHRMIDRIEVPMELRIEEFHLECHLHEARQDGENVQELVRELEEVRKELRDLRVKSD